MQARGGKVITVHPGQTVYTPPGEEHWHGAGPESVMEHLALVQLTDDGDRATWLGHVTDGEYEGEGCADRHSHCVQPAASVEG